VTGDWWLVTRDWRLGTGDRETRRLRDWETERLGDWEIDVRCQVSDVRYQKSDIRNLKSEI